MNRIIYTIITLLLCGSAQGASRVNLDSLYRVLDAAIDSADIYLQQKTQRLETLKQEYAMAKTDIDRYHTAQKIYTEYIPFENDSAIAYQYRCIDLAEAMGRGDLKAATTLHLAYQLSNSGFYNEARIHLGEVPSEYLKGDLGISYLEGTNNLYGEMGYYSNDPRLRNAFREQVQQIRASLLTQLDTTSVAWLHLRTTSLDYSDQHQEALRYSDRWMQACTPGTRPYAIMAYYRSEIYKKMESHDLSHFDGIFCWNNSTDLIIAIIKLLEDSRNAPVDILENGVQCILLVEDSVRFYSIYLPELYRLILLQNSEAIRDALNESQQSLRKRARGKHERHGARGRQGIPATGEHAFEKCREFRRAAFLARGGTHVIEASTSGNARLSHTCDIDAILCARRGHELCRAALSGSRL